MDTTRITLKTRPQGLARLEDFHVERAPVPELQDGEIRVRVLYVSMDPAMRGWLRDVPSYIPPVQIGEVMRASGLGQVVASKAERFPVGSYVTGPTGWQTLATLRADRDVSPVLPQLAPLTAWLGALGMPGMTAYFGLLDVGQPKPGETVLVSAAAGAVGQITGQIARIKGCRVVGIAGGAEKCRFVTEELGFDACIDYKAEPDINKAIARECPNRVNVYFDNVGGDILNAALRRLARGARVVICGAISTYNDDTLPPGPANYMSLLVNRARMEGFVVFDYAARFPQAVTEMAGWIQDGRLKHREHVETGFERAPEVMNLLFTGGNFGKLLLKVQEPLGDSTVAGVAAAVAAN